MSIRATTMSQSESDALDSDEAWIVDFELEITLPLSNVNLKQELSNRLDIPTENIRITDISSDAVYEGDASTGEMVVVNPESKLTIWGQLRLP